MQCSFSPQQGPAPGIVLELCPRSCDGRLWPSIHLLFYGRATVSTIMLIAWSRFIILRPHPLAPAATAGLSGRAPWRPSESCQRMWLLADTCPVHLAHTT